MPRAGGTYTLPAGNPVVTLSVISSVWANNTMSDIATALTNSLPVDGSAPMTGQVRLVDGNVASPGFSWATETTSGWYRIGAGQFGFSVGGALSLSVNASEAWNIAAASAGSTLTVNQLTGNAAIQVIASAGQYGALNIQDGQTGTRNWSIIVGYNNAVAPGVFGVYDNTAAKTRLAITTVGGVVVNSPDSGYALSITGVAGSNSALVTGSATSGQSYGLATAAGTTSTDYSLVAQNKAGTATFLQLFGDGHGTLGPSFSSGIAWDTAGIVSIANGTGSLSPVYAGIPQNSQGGNYGLVLADANKHIYVFGAGTITIPANGSVAYPIGTAVTIINGNIGGNISIAITTDTLRLANSASTGTRTLANNGIATIIKVAATVWIITGAGVT